MFRVMIRGRFEGLSEEHRAALAGSVDASDIAFTSEGRFTYDRSLSAFTFRCEVPAEAEEEGEKEAAERAAARLHAHGYPVAILRVAVTDMRDIKIRRR